MKNENISIGFLPVCGLKLTIHMDRYLTASIANQNFTDKEVVNSKIQTWLCILY